jgi:hypothetical protein
MERAMLKKKDDYARVAKLEDPHHGSGMPRVDPSAGLTLRQAMLHYGERSLAQELIDLEAKQNPRLVRPVKEEELHAFWRTCERLDRSRREARSRLERTLIAKLASGVLTAYGHAKSAPLDEPARMISPDRWSTLKPDFVTSRAKGGGMHVSGILVFSQPAIAKTEPKPSRQFSEAAARTEYRRWVEQNEAAGMQPNRDQDAAAMRESLGVDAPRDFLRELRRELAPPAWRSHGRRRSEARSDSDHSGS